MPFIRGDKPMNERERRDVDAHLAEAVRRVVLVEDCFNVTDEQRAMLEAARRLLFLVRQQLPAKGQDTH